MRLKVIRLIIQVFFLVIAFDLFYLQVIQGDYFLNQSVNNRIRVIPLEGQRGRIVDRNGVILADNRLSFNVTVIPQDIRNKDELFDFLSDVLKTEKSKLLQMFWQKKVTPFAPVVVAEDVEKNMAMILEENKFRFPGLDIRETFRRSYPFGEVGGQVLGYVGAITDDRMDQMKDDGYTSRSIVGYSGLEEYYDQYLRGEEGGTQIEVNSRGQQVRLLGVRESSRGQDIHVSLDARVQQMAQQSLAGRRGAVIMMNLDNGEVLGLVSSPSFDPNVFVDSKLKSQKGPLIIDPNSPLLNRAIKGLYPPGSVFKIVVTAAALELEKITRDTTFMCNGYYQLGRRSFKCSHVHGAQNLIEGIAHSCNVYFFNVGSLLGPDPLEKYAHLLGLGSLTNIDLPFEETGSIPGQESRRRRKMGWYKGDTLNFSIGQGDVLVTPIQLLRMVATVARDGGELQPHLLTGIGDTDVISLPTVRTVPLKQEIIDTIKLGLKQAVADPEGTARVLNMEGFKIYGKTGTAQSAPGKDHHAWFVGYNLEGKMRVAFCVFLEYGGSSYNACVVAKEILLNMKAEGII